MAITFHAQVATHIGWMAARAGPGQLEGTFNDVAERLHFNPSIKGQNASMHRCEAGSVAEKT